jgi:hypothetical protein
LNVDFVAMVIYTMQFKLTVSTILVGDMVYICIAVGTPKNMKERVGIPLTG